MSVTTIRPQDFAKLQTDSDSVELIDVRTPAEFRELHVVGAKNVPLDRLDAQQLQANRNGSTDAPLYVICRSGSRGSQACQKLMQAGFADVINIEGGTLACETAGLEVNRGTKSMSLERQVRIAAGGLVFVGAVLGYFVNPYFIGIPTFVGMGLMFAGITDTCAMGMMLARMPWNQR